MNPVIVSRSPMIAARVIDDEAIIMSPVDSTVFSLNPTATAIWKALDGSTPLSEVVRQNVCANYEVDFETAMADALELVNRLANHGLMTISGEASR